MRLKKEYYTCSGWGEHEQYSLTDCQTTFSSQLGDFYLYENKVIKMLQVVESPEKTNFNLAMQDIGVE